MLEHFFTWLGLERSCDGFESGTSHKDADVPVIERPVQELNPKAIATF